MKRSPNERHIQTQGSLIETFFDDHRCLSHVFMYIYSLLIEKDICDRQNVLIKLPCVCVCLLSGNLFIFLVIVSSFFSYIVNMLSLHFKILLTD